MEKRRSPEGGVGWGGRVPAGVGGGERGGEEKAAGGERWPPGGRGVEKRRSPGVEIADGWRREGRRGGRDRRHCDGDD